MKRQRIITERTTAKAEPAEQSYFVYTAYKVHAITTARVITAARRTIPLPLCIPVAELIKLTIYDYASVNKPVNIIFCGYFLPPWQQNIQISQTIQTTKHRISTKGFSIWNLKKPKLYIERAVITTVTAIWHDNIVQTLWMKRVLAAPQRSVVFEGCGSVPIKV